MITWRLFLLVRRVLLFIHNDQRQIGHGREHGRARADHNPRLSAFDAMPLLGPFLIRERRMKNRYFLAEDLV